MRGNPFLNFHRSAEAAAYPALLIVSMVCLALVVTPVALLGLTRAVWVLALALLSMVFAVAVLAAAVDAALSDADESAVERTRPGVARPDEHDAIAPLPGRDQATPQTGEDRRAAA